MKPLMNKFNARVHWSLRFALVAAIGIGAAQWVPAMIHNGWAVQMKLSGRATICPWTRIAGYYSDQRHFSDGLQAARQQTALKKTDQSIDIKLISSPSRDFWIRVDPGDSGGLEYLLAEHQWIDEQMPQARVRKGDIVLDCGAHVGVFTHHALIRGAAKVVAIEPDPVNLECLRRNFATEIALGQVTLVPKGVWDSTERLTFFLGKSPSLNSAVDQPRQGYSGRTMELEVTTIDRIAQDLGLERVDYIKMDIEGAERKALQGAAETLRRYRPRLLLDSYHRRDDMDVLPTIIRQAFADYSLQCGPCEPIFGENDLLVPHVTYYE